MRIDTLISQLLGLGTGAYGFQSPGSLSRLGISGLQGGGDRSSYRSTSTAPIALEPGVAAPSVNDPSTPVDSASFSTAALDQAAQSQPPSTDASNASGFPALVDSFTRKRTILAYHIPGVGPNGASMDLTFDVEVAYRVIQLVPSGSNLDVQA